MIRVMCFIYFIKLMALEFVINFLVCLLICWLSMLAAFLLQRSAIKTVVGVMELQPGLWISRRSRSSSLSSLKSSSTPVKLLYLNWLRFCQLLLEPHHFLNFGHNPVCFALLELELLVLQLWSNCWLDLVAQICTWRWLPSSSILLVFVYIIIWVYFIEDGLNLRRQRICCCWSSCWIEKHCFQFLEFEPELSWFSLGELHT